MVSLAHVIVATCAGLAATVALPGLGLVTDPFFNFTADEGFARELADPSLATVPRGPRGRPRAHSSRSLFSRRVLWDLCKRLLRCLGFGGGDEDKDSGDSSDFEETPGSKKEDLKVLTKTQDQHILNDRKVELIKEDLKHGKGLSEALNDNHVSVGKQAAIRGIKEDIVSTKDDPVVVNTDRDLVVKIEDPIVKNNIVVNPIVDNKTKVDHSEATGANNKSDAPDPEPKHEDPAVPKPDQIPAKPEQPQGEEIKREFDSGSGSVDGSDNTAVSDEATGDDSSSEKTNVPETSETPKKPQDPVVSKPNTTVPKEATNPDNNPEEKKPDPDTKATGGDDKGVKEQETGGRDTSAAGGGNDGAGSEGGGSNFFKDFIEKWMKCRPDDPVVEGECRRRELREYVYQQMDPKNSNPTAPCEKEDSVSGWKFSDFVEASCREDTFRDGYGHETPAKRKCSEGAKPCCWCKDDRTEPGMTCEGK